MLDAQSPALLIAGAVALVLGWQFLVTRLWRPTQDDTKEASMQSQLVDSSAFHVARRLQHLVSGLIVLYVFDSEMLTPEQSVGTLLVSCIAFYGLHLLRLRSPGLNRFLVDQLANSLRPEEAWGGRVPASFYFLLGCAFSMAIFPRGIASLAVLHLSVGDPAAGIFGVHFGSRRWGQMLGLSRTNGRGKTVDGSLGCFVACLLSTAGFLAARGCWKDSEKKTHIAADVIRSDGTSSYYAALLVSGIAGAVGEAIPVYTFDDNLTLPLVSGLMMWSMLSLPPLCGAT